ncbi:MAG TPA: hypothetical protein VFP10_09760 [Candidatus Eisenbacteria bacterium]|nr:hypothetical protein [Candidatus Eisenbacteria bacterium]
MIRCVRLILITTLLVSTGTALVNAQCDIRGELGRAASLLKRVERPVEQSGSADARELHRAASRRLHEAEERARSGDTENACRLARLSQSLSQQASDIIRPGRGPRASGEVEGMLEATDRALEDASRRLPSRGAKEGQNLLKSARSQQVEARAAFQEGRPRVALKLTLMARETARRALRPGQGVYIPDSRSASDEMEQTDRFLNEARRILDVHDGSGASMISRAERQQEEARQHLARGRPEMALSLTRESRANARRALDKAKVNPDPREVNAFLQSTQDLVRRLEPQAKAARHGAALEHLRRARSLLAEARRARDAGRWSDAFGATRAASALATDVSEMLQRAREE